MILKVNFKFFYFFYSDTVFQQWPIIESTRRKWKRQNIMSILTCVVFTVVLFHDALVAEAQVHFGSVSPANRIVIIRALGLAFPGRRDCCCRAGWLNFVAGADLFVVGRSTVDGYYCDG